MGAKRKRPLVPLLAGQGLQLPLSKLMSITNSIGQKLPAVSGGEWNLKSANLGSSLGSALSHLCVIIWSKLLDLCGRHLQ